MTAGLLDTSVVIAIARGEEVELPERATVSVLTVCELHHGVLVADERSRPGRLAVLGLVERSFDPLPVDSRVAPHFGRIVAEARARGRRPAVADALIAATALSHGLELYSRDRDFEKLELPNLRLV